MSNQKIPFGIGTDIIDIDRFKSKPLEKNLNFYKKIFSDSEIKYCKKFRSSYEHFAGKFAIKESIKKSIKKNVRMTDIITSHINDKPNVEINGENNYEFIVSVTHENRFAVAVVISELI